MICKYTKMADDGISCAHCTFKKQTNCLIKLVRALLHFHLSQCKMQIADCTLQIGENYIQPLKKSRYDNELIKHYHINNQSLVRGKWYLAFHFLHSTLKKI